jgi:hypothetical protein
LEGQANGTALTCDPPKNFTATREYGGNVSWIDVSISSEGPDRAWLGLAIHLSTGESIDPSFGQQWTGTEDGRRFLTLSGEEWYTANVVFGEDPAAARGLADRCIKAYLGET